MSSNIPPLGTKGIYEVRAPFSLEPNHLYSCFAIRYFKDVENQGINVFDRYYLPYEIDRSVYETDRENNVAIVTLFSDVHAPLYIPSSFITRYPNLNTVNYNHVVLSISLGPLPDYMDLTFLKNQLANTASDVLGVTPNVKEHVTGVIDTITPEQHEILQIARQAAINNRSTDYSQLLELRRRNLVLEAKVRELEDIILENPQIL